MANRFLNNIRINDEYTFPVNDGSAGQAIVTDGSGNLSFGSAIASSADSTESIHISVKNTSGSQILKGTPVYVTGETGNSGKIEIAPADASNSAKMPALGILESTLSNNAEGFCVQGGLLEGLATATIDGTSTTANDTVYVKAGGGLTMTKPTGSNLIQNIAKVARVHASNGSLVVSSILRTNDVPNLTTGKIWVGQGNTIESSIVFLDEPNGRMGIGTTSPSARLDVRLSGTTGKVAEFHNSVGYGIGLTVQSDGGVNTINSESNQALAFATNGSSNERMRITSAGDVAIGNASSLGYKLYVNGNTYLNGTTHYIDGASIFRVAGGGSEVMRVASSGNVGIGTTSPGEKLVIAGNVLAYGNTGSIGSGTSYYLGNNSNSRDIVFTRVANAELGIGRYNGGWHETMRFDADGNVGIGTTSPGTKLEVAGTTKVTNLTYEATASSGDYHGEIVYFGSGTLTAGGLYVLGNSSGTLVWSAAQDSTAALATGLLAIALGTSVSSGLLVRGHAQNSNWGLGWTVGDKLYLSDTAGSISNSLTTGSNDFVRIIGYYLGSNKIYFCPDNTFVQNVS